MERIRLTTRIAKNVLVIILVATLFFVGFALKSASRIVQRQKIGGELINSVFVYRNSLNSYVLSPNEATKEQLKNASLGLGVLLSGNFFNDRSVAADAQNMVQRIRLTSLQLNTVTMPLVDISIRQNIFHEQQAMAESLVSILNIFSRDTVREEYLLVLVSFALILVPLSLLFIIFFIVIPRRILQPIEAVHMGMRAVMRGDFHFQIATDAPNELGILAKSFNVMISRLQESYDAIRSKTEDLERRNEEISKLNKFMVGRELVMADLKKKLRDEEAQ